MRGSERRLAMHSLLKRTDVWILPRPAGCGTWTSWPWGPRPIGCAGASTPSNRVTFVIDRNINYTNICVSGCRFCAFYRPPGADGRLRPGLGRAGRQTHGTQGPRRQRRAAAGRPQPRVAAGAITWNWLSSSGISAWRSTGFRRRRFFIWRQTTGLSLEDTDPAPDGRGAELHPRGRGRDPGGPGAAADFAAKMLHLPVAGGHGRGAPPGPQDQRHHDVRAPGDPGRAARTPVQDSGTPGRNRRLHQLSSPGPTSPGAPT